MAPAAARARPAHRGRRRDGLGCQRRRERAAQHPGYATFGTAAASVTLPGSDPRLAADIAAIQGRWSPADLIENQKIYTGTAQSVQLRAESQHGHYNAPQLGLVSGAYPAGPGQVALTRQVASLYGAHVGGAWHAAGTTWQVTGIVQDPSNLADEFALVVPGQVAHPGQVTMLLGSPAVRQAIGNDGTTLPGIPAAATFTVPNATSGGISPATGVLVVEVAGLAFIGLVSVASFSVLAQRRLRALGMLSAIGATERNLRLVMMANGLAIGVAGALAGAVLGLAAWFAYAPALQQATGHVVDPANLPWWAFAFGVVFAVATSVLASRRPAKAMAAVPVVAALSGRPAPPKAVHRSALPGVIVFAGGLACLAFSGGWTGRGTGSGALLLLAGLVAVIAGVVLLAPLAIGVLAAGAHPRLPAAIRIALRDLVRYRARSGAALAAVTFAVFLAMAICLVASTKFGNPLDSIGPNLSSSQLIVGTQQSPGPGTMEQLSNAQVTSLSRRVNALAASLHAPVVRLESSATLFQADAPAHQDFSGSVYVATPQLLAAYGIKASQIPAGTDVLTMRPGLASLPHMEMVWHICTGLCHADEEPGGHGQPPCTLSNQCLAGPAIQTVSRLPGGTSAPNTVITEYAVSQYHLQTHLSGWLIQAPAPLTATQISTAQQLARTYGVTVETQSSNPSLGDFADGATALGAVIAFGVLAASAGLGAQQPVRHVRRPAARRRADPAGRAAAGRRRRRLAAGRPRAVADRQAAD
jgi:putative ABC transport system permease protein